MNYLDLCKRVSQEAGYSGSGPSKVTGQTGEMQRVVSWVQDAWIELQQQQKYWRFMLSSFDVTMNQGESSVTVAADYKRTKKDSVVVTRANGSKVYPTELAPEEMRQLLRDSADVPSYPHFFSIDDAGMMTVFPSCNESVTISGDYYRTPVTLAENTDVPHIREEYHMAIVWLALVSSGAFDESSNTYNFAHEKWEGFLNRIKDTELTKLSKGGPLA